MTIKEKALELYPVMLTDSDDWDIVEEQCDRKRERQAFAKGADFIIDKAAKYLVENLDSILSMTPDGEWYFLPNYVDNFKKAMEE